MIIGVIGGGASGMAAALAAAENTGNQVILFERQARLGRKLQATGNGRCNLTNVNASPEHYHGDTPDFSRNALAAFDVEQTLSWFREMGLFTVAEPSGRVYPYSDQANSVSDILRYALNRPNIQILTGTEVSRIRIREDGFLVEDVPCHRLIIACGGLAGTKLGGSVSGYRLLRSLGHRITKLRPALVQIKSSWPACTSLKGVRANCGVEIFRDGERFARSVGELQFTEYGISGPVVFEVSRDVCHGKGAWVCRLDFLPDIPQEVLEAELLRRRGTSLTTDDLLTGILHNRLGRVLTKEAGIAGGEPVSNMTGAEIVKVCTAVKSLELTLTETLGMDSAQVTAGGAVTAEFDPDTMESRLISGLYACGEVLDVDGDCGGYNLQWAWSSGVCAGRHAGRTEK